MPPQSTDKLSVELEITGDGKAEVIIGKSRKLFNDFVSDVQNAKPRLKFTIANESYTDLDKLEKRANEARVRLQEIAKVRLDSGQIGGFTKELVRAFERSQQLTRDIQNVKKELANPNRKTSVSFLIDELKSAEAEATALNRKLQTLRAPAAAQTNSTQIGTGLASGFNNNALLAGITGGVIGAGAIGAISAAQNAVSSLLSTVTDLSVESIKLAGDFEATTNSLAVFAGGTSNARRELLEVSRLALDTPGLRLEAAEKGYQRLRALNFEAKVSQDLIKGLGTQRVLSGADNGAVERVITNLTQLTSGSGTAADVRQTIQAIPSLRKIFQGAFGTADFGDINKIAKENPDLFIKKFTEELGKAKTAQAGLNVSIEKGSDAVIQAGRSFGEPFLKPLTQDIQSLTKYLNENAGVVESWGQKSSDAYRGVSATFSAVFENSGEGSALGKTFRSLLSNISGGYSELLLSFGGLVTDLGKQERIAEDTIKNLENGLDFSGAKVTLDPLTNTLVYLRDTADSVPSLKEKLDPEETAKAVEKLRKNFGELIELNNQIKLSEVGQNLELNKAIAVRDAKGDTLKIARQTAELEAAAIREQITLAKNLAADKLLNLSNSDFDLGKGFQITKQRDAEIEKLNNQLLLNQINLQTQQAEKYQSLVNDLQKTLISNGAERNPFVKLLSDVDEVGKRAEKQFGKVKEAVKAAVETSNAAKLLNEARFGSNLQSLKFNQEARRLSTQPDSYFADFQRKLDLVEKKVDFISKVGELDKQINEARFYSDRFNPNNPKSFDESRFSFAERDRFAETAGNRRRGESTDEFDKRRAEAIQTGIQIQTSLEDINRLRGISLEGTGVLGEAAIAAKILSSIPKREDLLRQLNSPYIATRENAQFLLSEQSTAFQVKREAEQKKFQDFIANQQVTELNKKDAYESLNLLNNSKGLDRNFQLQQVLAITGELGNDLDATLRRGRVNALRESAKNESKKEQEAKEYNTYVKTALDGIYKALTGEGIVVQEESRGNTNVTVLSGDSNSDDSNRGLPASPRQEDVQIMYGGGLNFEADRGSR